MSYDNETRQKLKDKISRLGESYTISISKDYAVVEGHKGVLYFGGDKIVLRLKTGIVTLEGENLAIAGSQKNEIVISGRVISAQVGEDMK